jgi:hypothetical protein
MLVACRLAGLSALEAYYAGVRVGAQCGPTRSPTRLRPRVTPGPCASRRRQGAFLPTPPRRPTRPQPQASKGPTERGLQWPSATTGAGRPTATTISSFHQCRIASVIIAAVGTYFQQTAFSQKQAAKGPPPRVTAPVRRFSIPQGLAFGAAILLRRVASTCGIHLSPRGEALTARVGCGEFPLFAYRALRGWYRKRESLSLRNGRSGFCWPQQFCDANVPLNFRAAISEAWRHSGDIKVDRSS